MLQWWGVAGRQADRAIECRQHHQRQLLLEFDMQIASRSTLADAKRRQAVENVSTGMCRSCHLQ